VYDPKVTEIQMLSDLNYLNTRSNDLNEQSLRAFPDPYEIFNDSHAIVLLTEWDEFKTYDWEKIFSQMKKPAFIFDGRNVLNKVTIERIGFKLYTIGK